MRTTLTVDDDLAEDLEERARQTRRPFKVVVNEAIRVGLATLSPPKEPPFVVIPHAGGLRPGIDDRRFNELAFDDELSNPPLTSRARA